MRKDPSLRLPILTEASDFENLRWLTDEEKKIGAAMAEGQALGTIDDRLPDRAALKRREPLFIRFYDPGLGNTGKRPYDEIAMTVAGMTGPDINKAISHPEGLVTDDPDQRRGYRELMLYVFAVAHVLKDEWTLRLMATKPKLFTAEESAMIGFPASNVWNDYERFVLEFAYAVLSCSSTDQLFDRAVDTWGIQGVHRRASWIGHYHSLLIVANLNVSDAYKRGEVR